MKNAKEVLADLAFTAWLLLPLILVVAGAALFGNWVAERNYTLDYYHAGYLTLILSILFAGLYWGYTRWKWREIY